MVTSTPGATTRRDWLAVVVGGLRCASGVSFLVSPDAGRVERARAYAKQANGSR